MIAFLLCLSIAGTCLGQMGPPPGHGAGMGMGGGAPSMRMGAGASMGTGASIGTGGGMGAGGMSPHHLMGEPGENPFALDGMCWSLEKQLRAAMGPNSSPKEMMADKVHAAITNYLIGGGEIPSSGGGNVACTIRNAKKGAGKKPISNTDLATAVSEKVADSGCRIPCFDATTGMWAQPPPGMAPPSPTPALNIAPPPPAFDPVMGGMGTLADPYNQGFGGRRGFDPTIGGPGQFDLTLSPGQQNQRMRGQSAFDHGMRGSDFNQGMGNGPYDPTMSPGMYDPTMGNQGPYDPMMGRRRDSFMGRQGQFEQGMGRSDPVMGGSRFNERSRNQGMGSGQFDRGMRDRGSQRIATQEFGRQDASMRGREASFNQRMGRTGFHDRYPGTSEMSRSQYPRDSFQRRSASIDQQGLSRSTMEQSSSLRMAGEGRMNAGMDMTMRRGGTASGMTMHNERGGAASRLDMSMGRGGAVPGVDMPVGRGAAASRMEMSMRGGGAGPIGRGGAAPGMDMSMGRGGRVPGVDMPMGRGGRVPGVDMSMGRVGGLPGVDMPIGMVGAASGMEMSMRRGGGVPGVDMPMGRRGGVPGVDMPMRRGGGVPGVDVPIGRVGAASGMDMSMRRGGGVPGVDMSMGRGGGVPGVDMSMGRGGGEPGVDMSMGRGGAASGVHMSMGRGGGIPGVDMSIGRGRAASGVDMLMRRGGAVPGVDMSMGRGGGVPGVDMSMGRGGALPGVDMSMGRSGGVPGVDMHTRMGMGSNAGMNSDITSSQRQIRSPASSQLSLGSAEPQTGSGQLGLDNQARDSTSSSSSLFGVEVPPTSMGIYPMAQVSPKTGNNIAGTAENKPSLQNALPQASVGSSQASPGNAENSVPKDTTMSTSTSIPVTNQVSGVDNTGAGSQQGQGLATGEASAGMNTSGMKSKAGDIPQSSGIRPQSTDMMAQSQNMISSSPSSMSHSQDMFSGKSGLSNDMMLQQMPFPQERGGHMSNGNSDMFRQQNHLMNSEPSHRFNDFSQRSWHMHNQESRISFPGQRSRMFSGTGMPQEPMVKDMGRNQPMFSSQFRGRNGFISAAAGSPEQTFSKRPPINSVDHRPSNFDLRGPTKQSQNVISSPANPVSFADSNVGNNQMRTSSINGLQPNNIGSSPGTLGDPSASQIDTRIQNTILEAGVNSIQSPTPDMGSQAGMKGASMDQSQSSQLTGPQGPAMHGSSQGNSVDVGLMQPGGPHDPAMGPDPSVGPNTGMPLDSMSNQGTALHPVHSGIVDMATAVDPFNGIGMGDPLSMMGMAGDPLSMHMGHPLDPSHGAGMSMGPLFDQQHSGSMGGGFDAGPHNGAGMGGGPPFDPQPSGSMGGGFDAGPQHGAGMGGGPPFDPQPSGGMGGGFDAGPQHGAGMGGGPPFDPQPSGIMGGGFDAGPQHGAGMGGGPPFDPHHSGPTGGGMDFGPHHGARMGGGPPYDPRYDGQIGGGMDFGPPPSSMSDPLLFI